MSTRLGTLGLHLEGRPCRGACPFCYLGARPPSSGPGLSPTVAAEVVAALSAREIAVAISEPADTWRAHFEAIRGAAAARALPFTVTTTPAVAAAAPWLADGCTRLALSVDPVKGPVDPAALSALAARLARPGLEVMALVTLVSPAFVAELAAGLLARLLDAPGIDAVALNGLKPPPPWMGKEGWLRFLAGIGPLLDEHLEQRLHLDCFVAARIVGLGDCPGKTDVAAGREFRRCVYQPHADLVFADAAELARRLADFAVPTVCPFAIV